MYIDTVFPPEGLVPLTDKQSPICSRTDPFDPFYVYDRGVVDISNFQEYIKSLPDSIWEDKNQEGNVNLIRPAHDRWGIKKIIFTFCDDFLQKIFDLPWSQLEIWKKHLLPIYAAVGISESQVVRSLLASMPSGSSIPVHHGSS